jgi:hypothetical protein
MCGVGTKKVKLFLNARIKAGDPTAEMFRLLLEAETCNINAKKYYSDYRSRYYEEKYDNVNKLLSFLLSHKELNVKSGFQESDVPPANYIVYFEHPSFGQISFHCDISDGNLIFATHYDNDWDCLSNSSLLKLWYSIDKKYGEEIRGKHKDCITEENLNKNSKYCQKGKLLTAESNIILGGFETLLQLESIDFKISDLLLENMQYDFNKWVITMLKERGLDIDGLDTDKAYDMIIEMLSTDEKLSKLKSGITRKTLPLFTLNITEKDKAYINSMFEMKGNATGGKQLVFTGNFDEITVDESINKKIKAYIPFIQDKKRKLFRTAYISYIVEKFNIKPDFEDIEQGFQKSKKNSKAKRIREEKRKIRVIETVTAFLRQNPDKAYNFLL